MRLPLKIGALVASLFSQPQHRERRAGEEHPARAPGPRRRLRLAAVYDILVPGRLQRFDRPGTRLPAWMTIGRDQSASWSSRMGRHPRRSQLWRSRDHRGGRRSARAALVYIAAHAPDEGETESGNGKRYPAAGRDAIQKTPDG